MHIADALRLFDAAALPRVPRVEMIDIALGSVDVDDRHGGAGVSMQRFAQVSRPVGREIPIVTGEHGGVQREIDQHSGDTSVVPSGQHESLRIGRPERTVDVVRVQRFPIHARRTVFHAQSPVER